jgi:parallel beta-helix repeat protein
MKKTVSVFILLSVLFLVHTRLQFVDLATANFLPPAPPTVQVYIRADGSVDPATTPIERFGGVYVFVDNLLNHTLEIQRDNIVVDGAGFTLKGVGVNAGVTLSGRKNVTIKNLDVRNYVMSVWLQQSSKNTISNNRMLTFFNVILDSSSNNQITGNNITGQDTGFGYGVQVNEGSSNNTIIGNSFTDTGIGVRVEGGNYNLISGNCFIRGGTSVLVRCCYNIISKNNMVDGRGGISVTGPGSYNTIFGNNITGKSKCGIKIYHGSSNTVYENHVANSAVGVKLGFDLEFPDRKVEDNIFYHNNFVNNTQYVFIGYVPDSNFWNNGEKGNYWSNYNGTDNDGDGIGDTPYIIDANNTDYYPLMEPVEVPEPEIPDTVPEFPYWTPLLIMLFAVSAVAVIYRRKLRDTNHGRIVK